MCANQIVSAAVSVTTIDTANSNLDGTGTMSEVLVGANDGTCIKSVTIKATSSTSQGMVRLFIDISGTKTLWREIMVPAVTQGIIPSFAAALPGPILKSGQALYASTELSETFIVTAEGITWTNCPCAGAGG